ncbi:MAG: peptidoglycan DD-metalloendopeptidase family protein [Propionibacteriaceae bacterium]|jgi:murein DD-endopeptidase MepM/ murein hydrolase activator NlpD|nr:peptidoglycan DD-metalloendopeptidase family protein [Propionibacteriaceae bacterium]
MARGRRLLAGLVAAAALGGLVWGSPAADATPTIAEVKAQLDQYASDQAKLDQQVTTVSQRLENSQAELQTTQAEIEARRQAIADMQSQVAQVTLLQWQNKGIDPTLLVMASDDVEAMVDQLTATQWVSTTTNDLLQRYLLERAALADLETSQATVVAQIEADKAYVESLAAEANQKVDATTTLLNKLTAQQQAALAAERAKAAAPDGTALTDADLSDLVESAGLIKPITAGISSPYGWRSNPISGASELHDGVDYGSKCGAGIWAAANGVVIRVEYYYGFGNRVVIDHGTIGGRRVVTSYNHLSAFNTSVGATVAQGQVVGYVGSTGYSTGCHLHFCVYIDVDPKTQYAKANTDPEQLY